MQLHDLCGECGLQFTVSCQGIGAIFNGAFTDVFDIYCGFWGCGWAVGGGAGDRRGFQERATVAKEAGLWLRVSVADVRRGAGRALPYLKHCAVYICGRRTEKVYRTSSQWDKADGLAASCQVTTSGAAELRNQCVNGRSSRLKRNRHS